MLPPAPTRQVLILAERLTRATLAFDRLRAARYQALVVAQQPPPPPSASAAGGGAAAVNGRGAAGHRHGRTQVMRAGLAAGLRSYRAWCRKAPGWGLPQSGQEVAASGQCLASSSSEGVQPRELPAGKRDASCGCGWLFILPYTHPHSP